MIVSLRSRLSPLLRWPRRIAALLCLLLAAVTAGGGKVSGPGARATGAAAAAHQLPPGQVAVPVRIRSGPAGYLHAGDRVSLYAVADPASAASADSSGVAADDPAGSAVDPRAGSARDPGSSARDPSAASAHDPAAAVPRGPVVGAAHGPVAAGLVVLALPAGGAQLGDDSVTVLIAADRAAAGRIAERAAATFLAVLDEYP